MNEGVKFRKKPIIVEAQQWFPHQPHPHVKLSAAPEKDCGWLYISEGWWHGVAPGDWIIKGVKGEFYPCKPDIFEMTYERVSEGEPSRDSDHRGP